MKRKNENEKKKIDSSIARAFLLHFSSPARLSLPRVTLPLFTSPPSRAWYLPFGFFKGPPSKRSTMPRGPKKHLKRLNAPKHWMLGKLGGIFVSSSWRFAGRQRHADWPGTML